MHQIAESMACRRRRGPGRGPALAAEAGPAALHRPVLPGRGWTAESLLRCEMLIAAAERLNAKSAA